MKRRICYNCKTHKINIYDETAEIYENQHIFCYVCLESYDINLICYADLNYKDFKTDFHNDKVIYISP